MKILKNLWWFFKREKKHYLIGLSALLLISVLNLIPPKVVGYIIDKISKETLTPTNLAMVIGVFLLSAFSVYALRYLWRIFIFGTAFRLENEYRNTIYKHLTRMSTAFYQGHRSGELMALATNDLKSVQQVAGGGVLQLADSIFTGIAVLIAMVFTVNMRLTLIAIAPMPLLIFCSQLLSKKLHKTFHTAQEAFSDMNNRVLENINGIKVTKTFGQENHEINRFRTIVDDVFKKNLIVTRYDAMFDPMIYIILALSISLSFVYGSYLVINEEITTGNFVTFVSYIYQFSWPMMAIGFMYNLMNRGLVSYERIQELLNIPQDIENFEGSEKSLPEGDINFNIESFHYPDRDNGVNLSNVRFLLKEGETLGIVGKTGSGKSTIIKLLLREYDQYEGSIYFGELTSKQYDLFAYRSSFGVVPQDPFLFSMTILDNIRFGKPEASLDEVMEAARIAHVHDDIMELPMQYETLIGERGVSLSGGQKQRVAMARAILLNPECLILDDSLSAVDANTEEIILQHLRTLRKDKTTIIIAHRFSALQHAAHIIVLDNGQIIEEGNHESLVEAKGWYGQIFALQELSKEADSYE